MTYDTPPHGSSSVEDTKRPPTAHAVDRRRRDFFIVDNAVVDDYLPRIGPYAFTVYCYLVRLASKEGHAYPSAKRIAEACKMSDRQAREMLKLLEAEGLISVEPRFSTYGDQDSNLYTVEEVTRSGGGASGAGGVGHQVPPNKEYTHETHIPPNPPPGIENGEVSEREFWTPYREHLFHYFGRDCLNNEWDLLHTNLAKYRDSDDLPPEDIWRTWCKECKRRFRADNGGEMPRTVKPMLDFIALLTAERRDR